MIRRSPAVSSLPVLLVSLLVPLVASLALAGAAGAQDTLVLRHVTVVDVEAGTLVPDQAVVLRGGRIDAVGPDAEVGADGVRPEGAETLDGGGRFLLPGLWDLHVHGVEHLETLPLYLAHGVTGVRALGGDGPETVRLRDAVSARDILGPRILTAGPFLDGSREAADRVKVADAAAAEDAVKALLRMDVDLVKVHNGLDGATFVAVCEAARKRGLPVVGHLPRDLSPLAAVEAGLSGVEHANLLAERVLRKEDTTPEAVDARVAAWAAGEGAALAEALVARRAAFTPTLVAHRGLVRGADPGSGAWDDPRQAWCPPALDHDWREQLPLDLLPADFLAQRRLVDRACAGVTKALHHAGVMVLAGSDAGAPHVYPGAGLHDELALLVEAGLTPAEALRTATVDAAAALGWDEQLGAVKPGRIADLVLLEADPLADIEAVRDLHAVFSRGRLLDREMLDGLIDDAARLVPDGDGG